MLQSASDSRAPRWPASLGVIAYFVALNHGQLRSVCRAAQAIGVTRNMDHEREATTLLEETSLAYIGRWNRLVSTTNWDKGRIIYEWRSALQASGVPTTEYSDEAWSRMVGGVTGQHAGRLRRVYERFGDVFAEYEGLYWSHFQAALDWDDAEMWLEGALQSRWSVAEMRRRRWQTMGAVESERPRDEEIVPTELDEDFSAAADTTQASAAHNSGQDLRSDDYTAEARSPAGPDFGDEDDVPARHDFAEPSFEGSTAPTADRVRPFADLPRLPDDLSTAFEAFQLAILRHRADGWQEVSCDDVAASLEALKSLALAPLEDAAAS